MRARTRYLSGLVTVGVFGAVGVALASPAGRTELAGGIALGFLVQAPLGWLTVRSLGTEKFQVVWALGMVIRLAMVALTGLVLVPALGWRMAPTLAGLVTTILVLLVVEVVTVMRENSGLKAR